MSVSPEVLRELVDRARETFVAHHAAEVAKREAVSKLEDARAQKAEAARELSGALEMLPGRSLMIAVMEEDEAVSGWELATGPGAIPGSTYPQFVEFYPKPFAVVR